jgi:hypothetical protein
MLLFYECESWSVSVKEEHRPRVFENRLLRKVFGPKREKVTAGWINCHIFCNGEQTKKDEIGGACRTHRR